jgi:phage/plasmid-associated DNA primase
MYERDVSNTMGRRARLLHFPFSFVDNPDPKKKEQKQADLSLNEKFTTNEYGAQFLMMGLENLQRLQKPRNYDTKRKLYEVPQSVKATSKAYVYDNNPIRYFVKECIIRERKPCSVIMLKPMMERWRSWARENLCESQCLKWDARDLESVLQKYDIRIKKKTSAVIMAIGLGTPLMMLMVHIVG